MNFTHGVENGGTPIGDRKSLEVLAKQINDRERQIYVEKCKLWIKEQEAKTRANKAQGNV